MENPGGVTRVRVSTYALSGRLDCSGSTCPVRGSCTGLSRKSGSRLARYVAEARSDYRYFGTFTVRDWENRTGADFKGALDVFLRGFMRLQRNSSESDPLDTSVLWFLEFQERGAPHVHIMYTDWVGWQDAARIWCAAVGDPSIYSTCCKLETFRSGRGGAIAYARKYATKGAGVTLGSMGAELAESGKIDADLVLAWADGDVTDAEFHRVVVAALKKSGDKRYQKLVPPWYGSPGRFWGVRGCRAIVAAATTATAEQGGRLLLSQLYALARARAAESGAGNGRVRVTRFERGVGFIAWGWGPAWDQLRADAADLIEEHSERWGTRPLEQIGAEL